MYLKEQWEFPWLQQGTDGSRHPWEAFPGILARIWPRIRSGSSSVGARMDFHVDPGNRPWNGAWNNGSRLESAWEHPRGGGIRPNSLNQLFSVFHFDFSRLSSRRRFRSRAEPSGGSSTIPDFFPVFFFLGSAASREHTPGTYLRAGARGSPGSAGIFPLEAEFWDRSTEEEEEEGKAPEHPRRAAGWENSRESP